MFQATIHSYQKMEDTISKSTPKTKRITVVTGANKGIGLEICRQLELASNGVMVLLTARDEGRGIEAIEKLKASGVTDVVFHQLDVTDSASIDSLAQFISTHLGKIDILVNNAGIASEALEPNANEQQGGTASLDKAIIETYEKAEECLDINYYGAKRVTEALIPLLQLSHSPKIVNVSSRYGKLRYIPSGIIRKDLGDVDDLTEERLDELLQSFLKDFKDDKLEVNGWPVKKSAYIVSKASLGAYTRILAKRYPTFCINCVTPGFVKTDINRNTGIFTVEEGARGPVMLALLPDGGPSGVFYDQTKASTFE